MKNLLLLCYAITTLFSLPSRAFCITSVTLPKEANQIAEMRLAGLNKDVTKIPMLIESLKQSHDSSHSLTALHALAEMGAVEALPEIESLENSKNSIIAAYARVAAARLVAEHSVASSSSVAMSSSGSLSPETVLNKFYEAIQLPPDMINANVSRISARHDHPLTKDDELSTPVGLYVMRETADIAYHEFPRNPALPSDLPALNFSLDYPSALKMRLAPLTTEQRISVMIADLSEKKKLNTNDDYEIQLLADEGTFASDAIDAKLREMDVDRQHYKGMGFAALFQALEAMGIQGQASTIDHFRDDKDGDVEYYANQAYYNVKMGLKQPLTAAY